MGFKVSIKGESGLRANITTRAAVFGTLVLPIAIGILAGLGNFR